MRRTLGVVILLSAVHACVLGQTAKPKLTIDEFFNFVSFDSLKVAPDGNSVLIVAERPDWEQQIFRKELWLYRISGDSGTLVPLTQSGHDTTPEWSPDGKWIAFLSERKSAKGKGSGEDADSGDDDDKTAQLYLISPNGGEAFAVTSGSEEVHSFAWSTDSKSLYFATRQPWSKQQEDDHKKEWKDVKRFRGDERGDVIYKIGLDEAIARHAALGSRQIPDEQKDSNQTPGAAKIAQTTLRINQMTISADGRRLAYLTDSISQRQENPADIEIYTVDLTKSATDTTPARLTHNEAVELNLRWAPDNRHVFFQVNLGSVEGKYVDPQPRLYWVDADSGKTERWFADFSGEVVKYTVLQDGSALCACRLGTEVQMYSKASPAAPLVKREGWAGAYDTTDSARNAARIAFVYSANERPTEIYLADSAAKLPSARPITSFNKLFTERDLPNAKPYHWTSTDGTPIEGMLMYPPGKFGAKNLPMFVFIHGGPQDADGNRFAADWYQWDRLAATQGWLVFEPNYRGSTGYGDKFALAIVPEAFSAPGRDILAGVDALVKDGLADQNHLAIGGYSYGGYMTNWLITQTTRFKAAVTGAGGVENVADWGNDDSTFDDAYFLGGTPWQARQRYDSEAAIFQIDKVRTPTHMVAGGDDIRVPTLESYLLDRALRDLNVPSELLILPGEGHELDKNPWHGKIKVREELKWLQMYGGIGTN
ncbi:MAG TPA: prolyl oligopeptidase family serine peptidase [Terriglobales bacterium]|nr:prolyl oligopeptidase family serine peptidase [Terriglobales bacterium]